MGCVQAVVGKKKFLFQFEDGQKKEMSSFSLSYLCSKEKACLETEDPILYPPPKEQGELLTIDGYPVVEEPCMFERGMHFSMFYCLCYVTEIPTDMLEEQISEERDPDLDEEEDIRMEYSREEHWKYFYEDDKDKSKIHGPGVGCLHKIEGGVDKYRVFGVRSASERGEHCLDLCEG